jgi:hypothetical protein
MKLDYCAVCGTTEDLQQHHLVPVVKSGVNRHKKRYNENTKLKDAKWQDCFLRLFELGVITDDGELTVCSYHHNCLHGIQKFQTMTASNLVKVAVEKRRKEGGNWGKGKLITKEQTKEIILLRAQGLSYRQIVSKVGVSLGSVQYHLNGNKKTKNPLTINA